MICMESNIRIDETISTSYYESNLEFFEQCKSRTANIDNLKETEFYFNDQGQLCAYYIQYWVAGGILYHFEYDMNVYIK